MHRSDAPSNRRRSAANSPTQPTEASHAGFGGTEETESRTAVQDDAGSVAHTAGSAHDATGGGGAKRTRDQRSPSPQLGEQDEAVLSAYFLLLYTYIYGCVSK